MPKVKNIETTSEINIGLYNEKTIDNINSIDINNETIRFISNLIYNSIFEYNDNYNLEPKLIDNYAKIDEKNYVFKLQEGIVFHDGKILTSYDIKNTIEKIFANENSYYKNCVANIQNVRIIDNTTFRINLIENDDEFEKKLTFPILCKDKNIGTNSYKVKKINNEKILLENQKNGQLLNIYIYNDMENLYNDFRNKKLDLINSVKNVEYENYIGEFGYIETSYKGNEYIYLEFNEDNFFKNSRLKEAILSGINGNEIVTKVFNDKAYNIKNIVYDLDKVVEILEEQRYIYNGEEWKNKEKVLKLNILLDKNLLTNLEIAYIIKEQLEKVGIKIELIIENEEEYYKKVEKKEYDIFISNIEEKFYVIDSEIKNMIICNKLNLLHSRNLYGKITPIANNIFYNIDSWKKIIK